MVMANTHTSTQRNLEDLVRKIEALLTQADHPNTGKEEADVFRAKAEAMMFKYRIDEMSLNLSGEAAPVTQETPTWSTIDLCDATSEFSSYYYSMFLNVVSHLDIKCETTTETRDGTLMYVANVVGYESDRRFVQILWQSVRLSFGKNLEPKVDRTLSDMENCYNLRNAGMEGVRIAYLVFGDVAKSNRIKARNMARKWAEKIGEDSTSFSGRGNNMKLYRDSYASGFVATIRERLYSMTRARTISDQGTLVLASRSEAVTEALYERYPHRRPRPAVATSADSTYTQQENCPKCQKAKSGFCRDHGWMKPRAGKVRYANSGAMARGRSAAQEVNLGITSREI